MGEPDFATPSVIVEAAVDALRSGHTHYGDMNGDPELRSLIAKQSSSTAGYPIAPDSVLISHGGAAAITASILALIDPGDRVLLPEPTYSLYLDAIQLAGGEPVYIANRDDHHLDLEEIEVQAAGAKMLILCNPVNPTGAVFTRAELQTLAEVLDDSTFLMVDEAYAYLVYGEEPFTPALAVDALRDSLIYVQTLSKTYAMTGWRIGYVIAPPHIAKDIQLVHRTMNSAVNAAVQRAAITALTEGEKLAAPMLYEYRDRRDFVVDRVSQIDNTSMVAPDGAFYAFIKYPGDLLSTEVTARLLTGGVAVRAGSEYGPSGEGHVRLSFAADLPTLDEGLNRLERVFKSLN
ncbi:pyridoxal phosphate-dependent aminotransferase (plasmid) [Rhodococcoides fascians]|uniref:pyridoxal phosphate-dependent aminotransferase n=1 Tax=Rhodococcoides fascians TaxID=1828 RepID=UPI00389B0716